MAKIREKKTLTESAKENPSQLGDPVSLKAETAQSEPTDQDRPSGADGDKSLKQLAHDKMETNPTQLGDPISLKAEYTKSEPTEDDRGAQKAHPNDAPKSKL